MESEHSESGTSNTNPDAPSREELQERVKRSILRGVIENPAYRVPEWIQRAIYKLATAIGERIEK